jgi:uncharacterized membrane protein
VISRLFVGVLGALAIVTGVGMVFLWPGDVSTQLGEGLAADSRKATVERVEETLCAGFTDQACQRVTVRLESGPGEGKTAQLQLDATAGLDPELDPGDEIYVQETARPPPGTEPVTGPGYVFVDFERRGPMLVLALVFVAAVLLFARLRGGLSLLGLGVSIAIVLLFVVPAILDRKPPFTVAVVGAMAIALITIPLAHGGGSKSRAAILGTAASLLLTAGLAALFTELAHLTGISSEEATILQLSGANLSLEGMLLAGMVIGALGVLDDVTISQASTVLALRTANPALRFHELFALALRVGRDHVSATVNTLVLAYVGASLPVLLIFSSTELSVGEALNFEIVAEEVVAILVGSIGLIAAVPITTALAALLALGEPVQRGERSAPTHAH